MFWVFYEYRLVSSHRDLRGLARGPVRQGWRIRLVGDLVVGVIGAVLGGFVFGLMGISAGGTLVSLVCATVNAVLLLVILRAIKRCR